MPEEREWITFTIDGREVRAPDGELLVDAAKRGDVEIPFFCYEKKLVDPVGACRMCLVEIEGIPKLQTSCSTPIKDGMVVYTQTDRVKESQNAVVEFLLVNHPLDCPVCDKGGECPLQDISYGWGPGRSRTLEIKRNFPKPIALSPLVAIDRERCILCYRCVRFSQEVSEDSQLAFLERADHTFVGTFDGRPYVAPFSGNIVELCPVGALTSTAYRFRARPWDIEQAGSICTMCPSQCNISFTVRDERVERVLERQNDQVDNGWLCDLGRYGYQSIASDERVTEPLVRDGGFLRPTTWERAMEAAVAGLRKAGEATAALAGGAATNEEGYLLQRIVREALGSGHIDSRAASPIDPATVRWMTDPARAASVSDIDGASVILIVGADPINEAPILDLRIRKAIRHFGARLVVAADGPTALDGGAQERLTYRPGTAQSLLEALGHAVAEAEMSETLTSNGFGSHEGGGGEADSGSNGHGHKPSISDKEAFERAAGRAGLEAEQLADAARLIASADRVVVIWAERIGQPRFGFDAKLLEVPANANARGLREVGCLPNMAPGLDELAEPGMGWKQARDGEIDAFYLLGADPVRELPGRPAWDAALGKSFVVAHTQFLSQSALEHADVVFPAESYAEKDGTITHPDGRLQRVRPAVGRPGEVRAGWDVLVELGTRLGLDLGGYTASASIFKELAYAVPMYSGITLDEIGGKGVRWQEREPSAESQALFGGSIGPAEAAHEPATQEGLGLGVRQNLWTKPECSHSPVLEFLQAGQELLINPADAGRLDITNGEQVTVTSDGETITALAQVTVRAPAGAVYLFAGTADGNANELGDDSAIAVEVAKRAKVSG